jgi:hypothetical protein
MAEGKLLGVEKDGWIYIGKGYHIKKTPIQETELIMLSGYTIHNRDHAYGAILHNESIIEVLVRLYNQKKEKGKEVEIRGLEKVVIHYLE